MNKNQFKKLSKSDRNNIKKIPVTLINKPKAPSQARYTATGADQRSRTHVDGLERHIEAHGQQIPITVEPAGNGKFNIVCGNHRYTAIKKINPTGDVECLVKKFASEEERQNWQDEETFDKEPDLAGTADDAYKSAFNYIKMGIFGKPESLSQYDAKLVEKIREYLKAKARMDGRTAASAAKRALKDIASKNGKTGSADKFVSYSRVEAVEKIGAEYKEPGTGRKLFATAANIDDDGLNASRWVVNKKNEIKNHFANALYKRIKNQPARCVLFVYVEKLYGQDPDSLNKTRLDWLNEIETINNDTAILKGPIFDEILFIPQIQDSNDPITSEDLSKFLTPDDIKGFHRKDNK